MKSKFEKIKFLQSKKETRIALHERDLFLFGLYYFTESMVYPSAFFHKEWCIAFQGSEHLLLIAFRESAKTLWAMIKFIHNIAYRKKRFQMYYCFDKAKAKSRLFDIAVQLQTNKRLIRDFGGLFPGGVSKNTEAVMQKKSMSEFITTNGVMCKAMGIGSSPRGELFMSRDGTHRPDFIVLDDVDTLLSVQNVRIIEKNYRWVKDELLGGISDYCQIVFLGNVIKNDGIVPRFEKDYASDDKWNILRKALIENGKCTWPERYTQEKIDDKRRLLGETSWNQNMLLIAYTGGESVIKRTLIKYGRCDAYDRVVVGGDPAINENSLSDGFGITVTGYKGKYKYVLACYNLEGAEKDPFRSVNFLKGIYQTFSANRVRLESNGFQSIIGKLLRKEGVAVEETKTHKDKVTRLLEFQAEFEQGMIYFDPTGHGIKELVEELISFPNVIHDDRVDSMVISFTESKYKAV